jgi:hypothetical protein
MKRYKIWAGLGSVVLASSAASLSGAAAPRPSDDEAVQIAQAKGHGGHAAPMKAQTGEGEGGEGEGGSVEANLPPNLRLYRDVELIRGHLLVGGELIEAGRWNDALPHFVHPQEEIYGGISGQLKALNVPPFLTALKALAQTVKAKNKEAYLRARTSVDERLASVEQALRVQEQAWPAFALESMLEVLQTAAEEYEVAFEGGRISNVVEYQDSRGFVLEAERLFQSVADELEKKDTAATGAVRSALTDLKTAWPALQPPRAPAKDLGAVLADISKIELQLARLR